MRIAAVSIRNFRGIRRADLKNLDSVPVVTVAGANGSGKSLLLEAIIGAWRGQVVRPAQHVGSWGEEGSIRVTVTLNEIERVALEEFAGGDQDVPSTMELGLVIGKHGNSTPMDQHRRYASFLRDETFQEQHAFARIDLLPADRSIPRGEAASVNAALLSDQQAKEFRNRVYNFLYNRQVVQLQGVQSFLASLDYLELIAERQENVDVSRDFQLIAEAFEDATGKKIQRPRIDKQLGAHLEIATPSGASHGVDELSSGEQEVLGLMYYVRRLSAQGGVLLIDEPELHLHPALQRSLFSVIQTLGERSQAWVVTHAPKLVAMSELAGLVRMQPPANDDFNQARTLEEDEGRLKLQENLGMAASDLLQSSGMCVVEGSTDIDLFHKLFPIEMGRIALHAAGSAEAVEAVAHTLKDGDPQLPWLAVRDRDLLTDARRESLISKYMYVWERRTIENELLHAPLVATVFRAGGVEVDEGDIEEKLLSIAEGHREQIECDLVEAQLHAEFEHDAIEGSTPLDRLSAYLIAVRDTASRKNNAMAEAIDRVRSQLDSDWEKSWPALMDGKRALGELVAVSPFRSKANLVQALTHHFRENPDLGSPGLREVRRRLGGLLSGDK